MTLTFGSLFSGIGGFDLGFERAGLCCMWQVEIDEKCQDVLVRHFPNTKRYEDVLHVGRTNLESVDVICGGFPCQDLSVAGKRNGLAGERSGLWFEFARIVGELKPRIVVVKNVPGLLSSNRGRDFAIILRGLVKVGYGVAWRVLDAQYFGVPQRRRRVFVVASLGNGSCAEILFESESLSRDSAPRREAGAGVAATITERFAGGSNQWAPINESDNLQIVVARSLTARNGCNSGDTENLIAYSLPSEHRGLGNGWNTNYLPIAFDWQSGGDVRLNISEEHTSALQANQVPAIAGMGVRRLTPTECERLQGFPDGWTNGQADSVRYRQLGNAVCVNVAEWIGERIVKFA